MRGQSQDSEIMTAAETWLGCLTNWAIQAPYIFCFCFFSDVDSVNLLKIQDAVLSCERLVEVKKNHCEQLTRKNKDMESGVNGLQKELSETKEIKSQLEQQKVEWEQELCSLRYDVLVLRKYLNYFLFIYYLFIIYLFIYLFIIYLFIYF